eukprot:3285092-Rhodomonas_salina.1
MWLESHVRSLPVCPAGGPWQGSAGGHVPAQDRQRLGRTLQAEERQGLSICCVSCVVCRVSCVVCRVSCVVCCVSRVRAHFRAPPARVCSHSCTLIAKLPLAITTLTHTVSKASLQMANARVSYTHVTSAVQPDQEGLRRGSHGHCQVGVPPGMPPLPGTDLGRWRYQTNDPLGKPDGWYPYDGDVVTAGSAMSNMEEYWEQFQVPPPTVPPDSTEHGVLRDLERWKRCARRSQGSLCLY